MRLALVGVAAESAVRAAFSAEDEVRVVGPGAGGGALDEAARTPATALVLDLATGPGLGPAVLRYRQARPGCRVVLLAAGARPGDAAVDRIVAAGVYDVVVEVPELAGVLAGAPATLAAAARWLAPVQTHVGAAPQVVERRITRPLPSHPVVVAVTGLCGGVGTTVLAAALAGWLTRHRQEVVLAGAGAWHLAAICGRAEDEADMGRLLGGGQESRAHAEALSAVCLHATPEEVAGLVALRRWAWIIIDAGPAGADGDGAWVWPQPAADRQVLVLPSEEHRQTEHGGRWKPRLRALAGREAVLAMRWHPRDGRGALERAAAVITSMDDFRDQAVAPVPDLTDALRAGGWPLGVQVEDVRLDRCVRRLLEPLVGGL